MAKFSPGDLVKVTPSSEEVKIAKRRSNYPKTTVGYNDSGIIISVPVDTVGYIVARCSPHDLYEVCLPEKNKIVKIRDYSLELLEDRITAQL